MCFRLPAKSLENIFSSVAQQLDADELPKGSIGSMLRDYYGSLLHCVAAQYKRFHHYQPHTKQLTRQSWESYATLASWDPNDGGTLGSHRTIEALLKHGHPYKADGIIRGTFTEANNTEYAVNDEEAWIQFEAIDQVLNNSRTKPGINGRDWTKAGNAVGNNDLGRSDDQEASLRVFTFNLSSETDRRYVFSELFFPFPAPAISFKTLRRSHISQSCPKVQRLF